MLHRYLLLSRGDQCRKLLNTIMNGFGVFSSFLSRAGSAQPICITRSIFIARSHLPPCILLSPCKGQTRSVNRRCPGTGALISEKCGLWQTVKQLAESTSPAMRAPEKITTKIYEGLTFLPLHNTAVTSHILASHSTKS